MKKYFFITGASAGIGRSFAEALLDENHVLFLISRSEHTEISRQAILKNCRVHGISYDLSDTGGIQKLMASLFDHIEKKTCNGLYLINNASVTEPVKPIDKLDNEEIQANLNVNYLSPVMLASAFIRLAEKFEVEKKILNISSGAASTPHYGLSLYCSAKAALDQFSRCVAVEQNHRKYPVEIHSFSPGFVDTSMLRSLTEKNLDDFAARPLFEEVYRSGRAAEVQEVGRRVIALWMKGRFRHGEVSHLGEY
ncbi:MAG TPA: SDR family NAD(P)-dependent oxidoreductase [Bacteroidales bacterium]|nr:SDR family NAD(P)-dependent oxidoreductase [Bacteroidales bacterium]